MNASSLLRSDVVLRRDVADARCLCKRVCTGDFRDGGLVGCPVCSMETEFVWSVCYIPFPINHGPNVLCIIAALVMGTRVHRWIWGPWSMG